MADLALCVQGGLQQFELIVVYLLKVEVQFKVSHLGKVDQQQNV